MRVLVMNSRLPGWILTTTAVLVVLSCSALFNTSPAQGQVYERTLGTFGSSPGSFIKPVGVATDEDGRVLVVDVENENLQRFGSGNTVDIWRLEDTSPMFVALDMQDRIYITDSSCDCIRISDGESAFSTTWGSRGEKIGQFHKPAGIVATKTSVFIVDSGNHRVQRFSPEGEFEATWGSFGKMPGSFSSPLGIALSSEGNLLIVDSGNSRIQEFTQDGMLIKEWGREGSEDGEFTLPTDIAIDESGFVYVVDSGNHRIQIFEDTGKFVQSWGQLGSNAGEFKTPLCIAVDEDENIYISDSGNSRVQHFLAPTGIGADKTSWGSLKIGFRKKP